jgi:hypothetical protein
MPESDPSGQFAARLGGRPAPDDLCRLVNSPWLEAASGSAKQLKDAGLIFLDEGRLPALIETECRGRDDLEGVTRLAYAQAMADMVRYSGFVSEDAEGNAIGYWFGPDQVAIAAAPLMRFDTTGGFSILRGNGIAEAVLVIASHGDDRIFSELRDYLRERGFSIATQTIHDVQQPECSVLPQNTYLKLIQSYSADLSATLTPDTGAPVNIMTTNRGPDIH